MKKTLHGLPYFEIEFDIDGGLVDAAHASDATGFITSPAAGVTDVIAISHGWNNNMDEARRLYDDFFANFRARLDKGAIMAPASRTFAVVAVLWPSKKFEDADLIPGGAASLGPIGAAGGVGGGAVGAGPGGAPGPSDEQLRKLADDLKAYLRSPAVDAKLDAAKALIPNLETSAGDQAKFVELVRSSVGAQAASADDASDQFFARPAKDVMAELSKPLFTTPAPGGGGGAAGGVAGGLGGVAGGPGGGAAGFVGNFLGGIKNAAKNVLNFTTYYAMKARAGTVGTNGLNRVLRELKAGKPALKIHLVGHSFGGRLVAAAAHGPDNQPAVPVNSISLLQAAFSHNAFATKFDTTNDGLFRKVVTEGKVTGPIIVTHTRNDRAVGLAYPIASRLASQKASALGDENDTYGGIGRNGALVKFTPEAAAGQLLAVDVAYQFAAGKRIHNLGADQFITNHGDVARAEVAQAVLSAIATT
jgi:pimeloyl-ACP methyl ester carboxylesterase